MFNHANTIKSVRNKACRDCSSVIWYDLSNHQWCDDSKLTIRHKCERWHPSEKAREDTLETILNKVSEIEFKTAKYGSVMMEIKSKLDEVLRR